MHHASAPDTASSLQSEIERFFERGEFAGQEEGFDERCRAFAVRAACLGESGDAILDFMDASIDAYEPVLRAISDLGFLLAHAKAGTPVEWRHVAARVRERLDEAGRRYAPDDINHAVANLSMVLEGTVAFLAGRAI